MFLVRHGQSTWNADGRWQGQADPPLSALGEHQASAAAVAVRHLGVTRVLASDLERARRTAELAAPEGVRCDVDAAWRERHAGEWTGLRRAEIEAQYPGYLDDHRRPPAYEGDESLLARVLPALAALADPAGLADPDGIVLVVTHGGVIGAIERRLGAPWVPVPNLGGRWLHISRDTSPDEGFVLGERELLIDPDAVALTVPDQI